MLVFLLSALLAAPAFAAPARGDRAKKDAPIQEPALAPLLREGHWRLAIGGILCNACTRAVVEGFLQVEGVAKASFDFEDGYLKLTVDHNKQVRTSKLERALRLAARRVDLETRYTLSETRYEGPNLEKPAAPKPVGAPKPKPVAPAPPPVTPADFPNPTPE